MEEGRCRNCNKRRYVYRVQRQGGGTFRRGGRWYRSSLCFDCIQKLVSYANDTQRTVGGFSVSGLKKIMVAEGRGWEAGMGE